MATLVPVTISNLPHKAVTPLTGTERVPMDQGGVTVDAPVSAIAALATTALSDVTPQSLGTAAAGTATAASRSDHRHAMPTAAQVGADSAGTAAAAVAAHAAAADPHSQYLTQAEGDAAYATKANNLSDLLDFDAARTNIGAARAGDIGFSGLTLSGLVLAGRYSTGVGGLQEINLGTGLSFTGSVMNGFDRTSPGAIGGTLAAAGSFTALSASTSLLLPNSAGTAAGHAYRSGDTIRYRDSSNVERLLLNSADNLANLGNTATARTNLGLATVAATGAYNDLSGKPLASSGGQLMTAVFFT